MIFRICTTTLGFAWFILICAQDMQAQVYTPIENPSYILTPKPSPKPRINGAKVFGVRPGSPFLYTIPVTGKRPMFFSADGLPKGLNLDTETGLITGSLEKQGKYIVKLKATNALGTAEREFRIVVGNKISLSPPMGWNSWNCYGHDVSAKDIYANAKAMIETGLINHGWRYINIDVGWQSGKRGGKFHAIIPNAKFPDMQALADYVHSLSLKIGIYSSPWISTYGGMEHEYAGESADFKDGSFRKPVSDKDYERIGKYKFEWNDVQQWSDWGIDYLKYDWSPNDIPSVKRMADALRKSDRDIIYSISNGAPVELAADYMQYVNAVRSTVDLIDIWDRGNSNGHGGPQGVVDIWRYNPKWYPFHGPGHWADPDMLIVGWVGKPWPTSGGASKPTKLTVEEQYTHISLWSLWAAPLLMGCDLTKMDDFTLSLLTNDEVIEVNQDPLGNMATLVSRDRFKEVWAKELEDGSKAVGLFNLALETAVVKITWSDLGIEGTHLVRDLWRQKDIGEYNDQFEARVLGHGIILVKIRPS